MKVGSALRKRYAQLFGLLMLVLVATGWAPMAQAAPNCQASSATLSMPTTIVVQPDGPVGPIDGTTGTATIIFNCSGLPASKAANDYTATIQAGQTLATLDSTNNTSGPGITFATSINGLAVLVTALPVQATSRSCLACGPTSTAGYVPGAVTAPSSAAVGSYSGTVTASYTAQLIKTKATTIAAGTIKQTNLIPYWWYISGGSVNSTSQSLGATLVLPAITITLPTCTITAGNNQTVTLPTVDTSQLAAAGKTAGMTPFSIAVTGCPDGVDIASNVFNNGTVSNTTGNLTNTITGNGGAKNVQVQLLNGPGSSLSGALNLSKTSSAAAQNSGTFDVVNNAVTLNYYAQYYAAAAVTAGAVSVSIKYNITYQ
ncbi:fimbrial protein [Dyella kyungheensis]|jgi:type 1 fimbria pilin|uniref:fimbrial protein n=1 Tax=Dyella kyungheensis TaxID=1242174 RepID=UPI003CF81AA9